MSGKAKGFPVWNSTLRRRPMKRARPKEGKPFQRSTLNARSEKQSKRLTDYYKLTKPFLAANPICGICLARGISPARLATEVHHIRGRLGALLFDSRFWAPSCFPCRTWPHDNKEEARRLGVLAERNEWERMPEKAA